MDTLKKNSARIFAELLSNYFTDKEVSEINSLSKGFKFGTFSNLKICDRKQIETEFFKESNLVAHIDQIISYAKEKLERTKFLKFLLSTGQYAFDEGEGDISLEIYEMIIRDSKGKSADSVYLAEAKLLTADIYKKKNKWILSLKYLRESKEIYKRINDHNGMAKCSNMLGTIYGEIGDFKKAKNCFEESLDITKRLDDDNLLGIVEINLGIIYGIFSDYSKSRDYFNKSLKYFQKRGDKKRIAEIYNNLAMMEYNAGNFGISLDLFNKSIELCLVINYFQMLGLSFLGKSITYLKLKSLELASVFSDKALTVCNKTADRLSVADIYKVKGMIEKENCRYEESENLFKTSLMMNIELGNKLNEAETSLELGKLFNLTKEKRKSSEMFRNAITYYRNQGSEDKIREINSLLEMQP
jgi:tetratricopeptide (TPR) repeat protein